MPPRRAGGACPSFLTPGTSAQARVPRQSQYRCRNQWLCSSSLLLSSARRSSWAYKAQATPPSTSTLRIVRTHTTESPPQNEAPQEDASKPANSENQARLATLWRLIDKTAGGLPQGVPIDTFFRRLTPGPRKGRHAKHRITAAMQTDPSFGPLPPSLGDTEPTLPFQPFDGIQSTRTPNSQAKESPSTSSTYVRDSVSSIPPSTSIQSMPREGEPIESATISTAPELPVNERDRIAKLRLFAQDPERAVERHAALREYMKTPPAGAETPLKGLTSSFEDLRTKLGNYAVREWKTDWKKESSVELTWNSGANKGREQFRSRAVRVKFGGLKAELESREDGLEEGFVRTYTPVWLRDHCQCSSCVHPDTKQRLLDSFSIPLDIEPFETTVEDEGVSIKWDNRDGHVSFYPWTWLRQHTFVNDEMAKMPRLEEQKIFLGIYPNQDDVTVGYEEVMRDEGGVAEWTSKIYRFGYCYVDGCPVTPEATEALLKRIAFIRDTHYGAFWDFTSDLTHKDTAYTSLPLSAHTDTTYFTDPAGLQLFHLLSHTDGSGGSSLLVDGFQAAAILQEENPLAHSVLTSQNIPWHASGNEGLSIQPATSFPVLEYWQRSSISRAQLGRVRWNNDDRATMDHWRTVEQCMQWYEAAGEWAQLLKRRELEIWRQLEPGRPVIFDNWRMLHGRSAFTGKRRMCGGYINRDDWVSRYRMTNFGREAVLRAV